MYNIYTLGDFDIRFNDETILDAKGYQYKMLLLFKYFITFHGKKLLPENIIENLWIDSDFHDPKNVLRTQISRLRRMINLNEKNLESFYTIEHLNGYYLFKINDNCTIDIQLFEELINEGNLLKESNHERALLLLKEGLEIYKGEYLREMEHEEWVVPIRNRYRRLYLQGLFSYIEILKQQEKNEDIIKICEEAIEYEPYDENLHIYFIEALMEVGEKRYAMSHYEYITSRLYSHLNIKPSPRMKAIYKKLQLTEEHLEYDIDINKIDEELEEEHGNNGALICEPYYFKFLYNLEKRKKSRNSVANRFVGIVTIESTGYLSMEEKDIKESMIVLEDIIYHNLRKGDVLSKWNHRQLVSLLSDIEEKSLDIIVNRLQKKFYEKNKNRNIRLRIRFKPV